MLISHGWTAASVLGDRSFTLSEETRYYAGVQAEVGPKLHRLGKLLPMELTGLVRLPYAQIGRRGIAQVGKANSFCTNAHGEVTNAVHSLCAKKRVLVHFLAQNLA